MLRLVNEPKGRPLRLDPDVVSAAGGEPAFAARPKDAPAYHGFPVLEDVLVDGFQLGMIDDWEAEPLDYGDAFVVAPDGSRAGLDWEVHPERDIQRVLGFEPDRWGVWYVRFPREMRTREDARSNLAYVLPDLRPKWEEWLIWRSARFKLPYVLRDLWLRWWQRREMGRTSRSLGSRR